MATTTDTHFDEAQTALKNLRDFIRAAYDNPQANEYLAEAQDYIAEAWMSLFPEDDEEEATNS